VQRLCKLKLSVCSRIEALVPNDKILSSALSK